MIRVFIVCSGLGNVKRGFESFAQECFDALSQEPELDIILFKGGNKYHPKEIPLWNLRRASKQTIQLGKLLKKDAYYIEQASFVFSLLPYIQRQQPDVIYFSDGTVGNALWHWRRLTKQRYQLLFSNGGPLSPPFDRWDYVQQVAPKHFQVAIDAGESAKKQSLLPYGIKLRAELKSLPISEREALRRKLDLPEERAIILSVGAINKSHKRMDYLIEEVARLSKPRPYLLLLGQQEAESSEIIQRGKQLLGTENFQVRTVAHNQIADYYSVADIFVLASLSEGFGRVLLEAMSHGLPCLAHDYETSHFVLGEEGYFANFTQPGSLERLMTQALEEGYNPVKRQQRHRSIYERFSWERLRPSYIKMIQHCVSSFQEI